MADIDTNEIADNLKRMVCPTHKKQAKVKATSTGIQLSEVCCDKFEAILLKENDEHIADQIVKGLNF